ncbi:BON domain-containing protein [Novosphingobium sp. ZW T3_23]|uniref:BON domain-containing protein n=1 Tax=Novosphingobium sp. ZW T3_23 TaxID=3378084 RepID=UPI003854FEF1
MNRRDSNFGGQQSGDYRSENSDWDSPRQANQWQGESPRQTGGWGNDDDQSTRYSDGGRNRPETSSGDFEGRYRGGSREEAGYRETGYREGGRYGRGRGYREQRYGDDYQNRDREQSYRFSGDRGAYPSREYDASGGNDFSSFTSEDYGGRDFFAPRGGGGGGLSPSFSYRPTFDTFGRGYYGSRASEDRTARNPRDYGDWREYGENRGFFERAGDEIASWFGDEDAARRREQDHRGRGPSDYTRSDERIREDVNDRLTQDWRVDATNIRVVAKDGEVTLEGSVGSRNAKRRAEDVAEDVSGVKHVQNNLRVTGGTNWTDTGQGASLSSTTRTGTASTTGSSSTLGSTTGSSTTGSTS